MAFFLPIDFFDRATILKQRADQRLIQERVQRDSSDSASPRSS